MKQTCFIFDVTAIHKEFRKTQKLPDRDRYLSNRQNPSGFKYESSMGIYFLKGRHGWQASLGMTMTSPLTRHRSLESNFDDPGSA
ncbi:hypothetical protein BDR06DRAFT_950633, partial [Suillus hirtellus]